MINEFEKIEDLGIKDYKVIQDKRGFCFGSDAVLLSRFVKLKKGARVLDMCTGTGIIPVLLWAMNDLSSIDAVEIIPHVASMAQRTMKLNSLEDKIKVECLDLKEAPAFYGKKVFDAVTCNPPYMNAGGGLVNPSDDLAIARHEIACSLDDVVKSARDVLKPCGKIFMVHRSDRLCDVISSLKGFSLFIHQAEKKLRLY